MISFLDLVRASPECGENTISPVIGGHIQPAKHLRGGDGLWVHPHLTVGDPDVCHGLHEDLDALCLPRACRAEDHETVAHGLRLVELDEFEYPRGVVNESGSIHLLVDGCLQVRVDSLGDGDPREQVIDETHEERLILVHQLGEVHVPQAPHDNHLLTVLWAAPLGRSESAEHREDITEAKVIMNLKI